MPETNPFVIRKMARGHIPQVLEIERASYPSPWSVKAFANEMMSASSVNIVAMEAMSVVGFLVAWIVVDQLHVANIAVAGDHRRRGVGGAMMKWLLAEAAQRGCATSTLEVRESNRAARSMYSQLGYCSVSIRKTYYSNPPEDAVVMMKTL